MFQLPAAAAAAAAAALLLLLASSPARAQATNPFAPMTPARGQSIPNLPILGFGTAGITTARAPAVIASAMSRGFRAFDTAMIYNNEVGVGQGVARGLRELGLQRREVWVTTKLWNSQHADPAQGLRESLQRMNLTYVDLYLMHFPVGEGARVARFDHVETWKKMERLAGPNGQARFIGVSNFSPKQMEDILSVATIRPKVHQFELHPYLQQTAFVDWHHQNNISVEAYAPLGNLSPYYYYYTSTRNPSPQPVRLDSNPVLVSIGKARGCTVPQVTLAWNMKRGVAVTPKAAQTAHQAENAATISKCILTDEDMQKIAGIAVQSSARFNNPCKRVNMPCYEGLAHPEQGG